MIDGFSDAQVITGLIALLGALLAAFFAWIVHRFDRLDENIDRIATKLTEKIDAVDAKLAARIDGLDAKLTARIDGVEARLSAKLESVTIAVSQLEGAVYHGLPEPRRTVSDS